MSSLLDTHWNAVKRILRYLRGTLYHGLSISRSDKLDLIGFSDADSASDRDACTLAPI